MNTQKLILSTASIDVIDYFVNVYGLGRLMVVNYASAKASLNLLHKYHNIMYTSENKSQISNELQKQPPDSICLSCFSGYIFSQSDIEHFTRPILNFHTGKIPENRGRCPLFWDIIEERDFSYATLHSVTSDIDMGIILQELSIKIHPNDNPRTLARKLLNQAFESNIFTKWIKASSEQIYSRPSVISKGSYKKAFNPKDNFCSSKRSVAELLLLWRCFQIWGGIFIDDVYYLGLYEQYVPNSIPIICICGKYIYGLK